LLTVGRIGNGQREGPHITNDGYLAAQIYCGAEDVACCQDPDRIIESSAFTETAFFNL
jgi:hypothetical protein